MVIYLHQLLYPLPPRFCSRNKTCFRTITPNISILTFFEFYPATVSPPSTSRGLICQLLQVHTLSIFSSQIAPIPPPPPQYGTGKQLTNRIVFQHAQRTMCSRPNESFVVASERHGDESHGDGTGFSCVAVRVNSVRFKRKVIGEELRWEEEIGVSWYLSSPWWMIGRTLGNFKLELLGSEAWVMLFSVAASKIRVSEPFPGTERVLAQAREVPELDWHFRPL